MTSNIASNLKSKLSYGLILSVLILAGCNYQVKKNAGDGTEGGLSKPTGAPIAFADVETKVLGPYCVKCHDEFGKYSDLMASGCVVPGKASESEIFNLLQNNGGDMPMRGPAISGEAAALVRDWINGGALENFPGPTDAKPAAPIPVQPAPAPAPQPIPGQPAPAPQPAPIPGEPAPAPAQPGPNPPPPAEIVNPTFTDLEAKVFSKKCTMCHSDQEKAAGFSLETYDGFIGNTRIVVAGNSAKSGLYISVDGAAAFMPPKRAVAAGKAQALTDDEKSALKAWLDAGALRN